MSRYDYRDPGTDSAYCDNISEPPSPPHRKGDEDCDCHECIDDRKSDDETLQPSRQTICEDCKGNGTIFEHVEHGFLEKCTCMTCLGSGYVKEEM